MSILDEALERQLRKILPKPKSVNPAPSAKAVPKDPSWYPKVEKSIQLAFQEGSSDKVYNVQLTQTGGKYEVCFQYGRRLGTHISGKKTTGPVSQWEAESVYRKLIQEKMAKGYKEI